MPFQKGNKEGLKGGRKKGQKSTNKTPLRNFRNLMADMIDRNWDSLQEKFDKLSPKEAFDVTFKMMEYVTPKLDKVALEPEDKELKIQIVYKENSS